MIAPYDEEEMRLIFEDYVLNDGFRWMSFSWDLVPETCLISPKRVWRGDRCRGPVFSREISNGSTSQRTAKEFAWDHFLNRGSCQDGRRVALYSLVSHDGMICLDKLFKTPRTSSEAEVIIRNAVWEKRREWTLEEKF